MNLYEIAEQCNCWLEDTGNLVTDDIDLKAFATLVRAAEREACAKVCDKLQEDIATEPKHCATEIRARGEKK